MGIKLRTAAVALTATISSAIFIPQTASASTTVAHNCGTMFSGSYAMCLYFDSPGYKLGAEFGTSNNIPSLNPSFNHGINYVFKSGPKGSDGSGQSVWNHAAGAANYDGCYAMQIWENSNYTGQYDVVDPGGVSQYLSTTKNNDTSIRRGGARGDC